MIAYRVDVLGRVVIPVQIRQQLGISAGTPIVCTLENGAVVMRPLQKSLFSVPEMVDIVTQAAAEAGVQLSREYVEQQVRTAIDSADAATIVKALHG